MIHAMPAPDDTSEIMLAATDLEHCELVAVAAGSAAYYTARLPGTESCNEDSLAVLGVDDRRAVLVVADGFGGQPAGDRASALAVSAMASCVTEAAGRATELRSAIMDGFERANAEVLNLGVGAATTLAVVEIDGDRVRAYHAGDSEVVLVGQRGRVRLSTMAHSPVGYALEAGWLSHADALHHEERHFVSNMIGTPDMRIDVGPPVKMRPRDRLLIATDGVFDNAGLGEIIETIRKGPLLASAALLVDRCRERMMRRRDGEPSKPDDIALVLYRNRPVTR